MKIQFWFPIYGLNLTKIFVFRTVDLHQSNLNLDSLSPPFDFKTDGLYVFNLEKDQYLSLLDYKPHNIIVGVACTSSQRFYVDLSSYRDYKHLLWYLSNDHGIKYLNKEIYIIWYNNYVFGNVNHFDDSNIDISLWPIFIFDFHLYDRPYIKDKLSCRWFKTDFLVYNNLHTSKPNGIHIIALSYNKKIF